MHSLDSGSVSRASRNDRRNCSAERVECIHRAWNHDPPERPALNWETERWELGWNWRKEYRNGEMVKILDRRIDSSQCYPKLVFVFSSSSSDLNEQHRTVLESIALTYEFSERLLCRLVWNRVRVRVQVAYPFSKPNACGHGPLLSVHLLSSVLHSLLSHRALSLSSAVGPPLSPVHSCVVQPYSLCSFSEP